MKAVIYGTLFIIGFVGLIGAMLYGCTVNILQTASHGNAKGVGELTSKEILDLNANLDLTGRVP